MKPVRCFSCLISQKSFQSLKLGRSSVHSIGTRTYFGGGKSEYKVTLLAFSGRLDPVFSVSPSHPKFNDVKARLDERKLAKRKLDLKQAVPSKLRYQGFLVKENDQYHYIAHGEAILLEKLLLEIGALSHEISPALFEVVLKCIDLDKLGRAPAKGCTTPCLSGVIKNPGPPLNLDKWNKNEYVRQNNNCYNYATDTMTCTKAQPGRGTGRMFSKVQPNFVLESAMSDGLKLVHPNPSPKETIPVPSENQWLVALFVSTNTGREDFHWYRLDNNGFWSHKCGQADASNVDASGNLITDPRKAAKRIPYEFVTFMYSKPTSPIL